MLYDCDNQSYGIAPISKQQYFLTLILDIKGIIKRKGIIIRNYSKQIFSFVCMVLFFMVFLSFNIALK